MILALDPGALHIAVALADIRDGHIIYAKHYPAPKNQRFTYHFAYTMCELALADLSPLCQQYGVSGVLLEAQEIRTRNGKGDPNDLLPLGVVNGIFGTLIRARCPTVPVRLVQAQDWKGSIAKEIKTAQILAALTPADVLCDRNHNTLDAVGLAKWGVERAPYLEWY